MKTLHFTNSWHETSGGVATFYRALIEEANRQGHSIRLVVPGERDRTEAVGEFGRIYQVQAPPSLFNRSYRTIYPSQFFPERSKLQQIVLAERPDLVEICDKYTLNYLGAVLRARLLRRLNFRPVVVGLSCERMDDNFRTYIGSIPLAQRFCSAYMRWVYFPFFDYHIANSQYTAAELRAVGQQQSGLRALWVRPMGVDLAHLSPQRRSAIVRRRLLDTFGAADESFLLLYAGRLVPEKNLRLLFELLEHLVRKGIENVGLLVVGDGVERQNWERHCAKKVPGRVVFLGHLKDRDAMADLYANCDAFVHPNPREPFGIAPLEAMASGLPLIAPDSGGVTSYANLQNAWTVPANVESFAAALEEVINNKDLVSRKVSYALQTAQRYGWENVASSFLELYGQMVRAARGEAEALPPPDFRSTPATGWRGSLFHGASTAAERAFALTSQLAFRTRHKSADARTTGELSS